MRGNQTLGHAHACLVTAAETLHGLRSVATRDRLTIWNRLESGEVHGSPTYAKLVTVTHH